MATHNLGINAEGIRIFREDLGIRTDLDLRQPEENGTGNITESPLGSDVNWINIPITGYEANIETGNNAVNLSYMKRFKSAMAVFSDINNYPVYLHCWGGADRTGTVAFMLEGLSGASEEDLAIDYELTSFSPLGSRFRYNQTDKGFTYANMIAKIKEFNGETLQEKFENYAVNLLGLTKAQVSNIQSILSGNGVVFKNEANDGEGTGINGKNVSWTLENLNGHTIQNVTFNGADIEYSFENNTLALNIPNNAGDGQIIFDDGNVLKFNGVNIGTNEYVDCNVAGKKGVTNVGRNAESLITLDFAQNMDKTTLTSENIKITNSAGTVIAYEPYSVTEKSYSVDLSVLSNLSKGKSKAQDLPQGDTYTVTVDGVKLADATEMAKTSFTFTTDLVLPIAYKEGSYIEDVSEGKNVEALNGIAYGVSALWGMLGNITDRAVFTKIRMNHAIKEQTDTVTLYDTDKPTYKLDLGREYSIAGMALTTIDAQTKSDWRMCNTTHGISKTETQSMSGVTECINIGNSFMATSDTTFFTKEEAPIGRYVYGAPNSESDMKAAYVGLSEIYVWAYMDIPEVTSNVDGKTGVTNVGTDSVGLIKVDFGTAINTPTSDNITLYVDGKKVEDYEFTATETGITIDPMYFSTFNAAANSRNIYPSDETKCSISISGVTDINNVDLGEYTFDFTSGVILPIAYKENTRIENVALGVPPTLAEGVTENKHNRGNKETVTDGVLYNNTWQGMFSPTFEASKANQIIYSLDLGAEYDIAGIALSGDDKGSGYNNFYAVGCDNISNAETMENDTLILKSTWTNSKVDYIGYNPQTSELTKNEILSNFNITDKRGRYIHVGTAIANRKQVTASEIMVWAYVDVVDVGISSNVAGKTGITNVGENSVGFVTLDFEDEVNVNSLNNVKIINPKGESVSYKPESATSTSYKIDLKYFSTLSSTKSAINDYDPAQSCGTFKIVIDGVKTLDGKYVRHKEISFETGLILPVSYKEGYIIENVALGKLPKLLGERKAEDTDNEAYVTDGRQIKEWKVLREHVTEGNAAFVLDLGAKYNIAGVAIAGVNSSYYDRRQLIGGSNDGTKTIMSDTTNYVTGLTLTVDWNQIISSFYDYGKTEAVRYIYAGSDTTCLGCRELYVWAYIEKSAPEMHFVNTADEVKVESRNAEGKTLILAWYDSSTNEMIGAVTSQTGTVKTAKNTDYKYKAFLWDSLSGLKPSLEAIEY